MNSTELVTFRHDLRTFLNHIVGFSDILIMDTELYKLDQQTPAFQKIIAICGRIQNTLNDHFKDDKILCKFYASPEYKRQIIHPVYDMIGESQDALKVFENSNLPNLAKDAIEITKACNNFLNLLEKGIGKYCIDQDPAQTESLNTVVTLRNTMPYDEVENNKGSILIVDDNELNRKILSRHLTRQGHAISTASEGDEAIQLIKANDYDVVLLDIMMPKVNGYQVLERLKSDEVLRNIPVIVISALENMESVIRCIELGAEDYLPKTFDPILLKARIGACIEKKRLRDQEQVYLSTILETQRNLERELTEAADYVRSLLPPRLEGDIESNYLFQPSAQLGGDCFGHHWIDDENLAVYLLDVTGHGIGAALLSVSVINILKSRSLSNADFHKPSEVLSELNHAFASESRNNLYFTILYAVFNTKTKTLSCASAGAPPLLLIDKNKIITEIHCQGVLIGASEDSVFETKEIAIEDDSILYIFSDGIYEQRKQDESLIGFKAFKDIIDYHAHKDDSDLTAVSNQIQALSGTDEFDDDLSLLELRFH